MDHATARKRVCVFSLHMLPRRSTQTIDLSKECNKPTVAMAQELLPSFDPSHEHHPVALCGACRQIVRRSHAGKVVRPLTHLDKVQRTLEQASRRPALLRRACGEVCAACSTVRSKWGGRRQGSRALLKRGRPAGSPNKVPTAASALSAANKQCSQSRAESSSPSYSSSSSMNSSSTSSSSTSSMTSTSSSSTSSACTTGDDEMYEDDELIRLFRRPDEPESKSSPSRIRGAPALIPWSYHDMLNKFASQNMSMRMLKGFLARERYRQGTRYATEPHLFEKITMVNGIFVDLFKVVKI